MHFSVDISQHRSSFSAVITSSPSASEHQNDDMGGAQVSCSLQGSSVAGSKHESVCQLPGPVQAMATQSGDSLQVDHDTALCKSASKDAKADDQTQLSQDGGPQPLPGRCSTHSSKKCTATLLQV